VGQAELPLRVITRHPSPRDQRLAEAVTLRAGLEKLAAAEAQRTGEYLRPILLLQAERVDGCEPLRDRLVSDFGVAKDEVKISVGVLDELKSACTRTGVVRIRGHLPARTSVEAQREGRRTFQIL
jgi:hypothetical protein